MSPPRAWFVADRWDGLGSRLTPLANAMAAAHALGVDFGFIWPQRADTLAYPARDLFSAGFCKRHELAPSDLERFVIVDQKEVFSRTPKEAVRFLSRVGRDCVVLSSHPSHIDGFRAEDPDDALARFRSAFDRLEWSDDALAIREMVATDVGPIGTALHARFGDLVEGAWSQFVSRGKYRSSALIEHAAMLTVDPLGILAISDSPEFVSRLCEHVPAVRAIADASPGYRSLPAAQRDWADMFALLLARRVLAPSASSFSSFATQASGGRLIDVLEVIPETERIPIMQAARQRAAGTGRFAERLEARDLCYLLDSDTGELTVPERVEIATTARLLDPEYSGAHAREAAALMADGGIDRALEAARIATGLARTNEVHDDPLLEAGSILIAATVVKETSADAPTDRERVIEWMRSEAAEMTALVPHHMHRADIARATRHLVLAFELAMDTAGMLYPGREARRLLEMLAPRGASALPTPPVWRDEAFDGVLGLLERMSAWLSTGMLLAARESHLDPAPVTPRAIRTLRPSDNGVRWMAIDLDATTAFRAVFVEHHTSPVAALGVPAWTSSARGHRQFWLPLPGEGAIGDVATFGSEWRVRGLV